jgi:hypothetical protein
LFDQTIYQAGRGHGLIYDWIKISFRLNASHQNTARRTFMILHHLDHHFAAGVTGVDVAHGLGRLAEGIGAVDDGFEFAVLNYLFEENQVFNVWFGGSDGDGLSTARV